MRFFSQFIFFIIIFIHIFLTESYHFSYAQEIPKAKSKEYELSKTDQDTTKIRLYTELCWLYRNNMPQKALYYGKKGLLLKNQLSNYDFSVLYSYLAVVYRNIGDDKTALEYVSNANLEAEKHNNTRQLAFSYQSMADILNRQGYIEKAEEKIRKALSLFKRLEDKEGIAYTYHTWGKIAENKKKYEQALHYHYQALEIRKSIGKKSNIASTQAQIGIIYKIIKKTDRALDYLIEAQKAFQEDDDTKGIINTLNNIAEISLEKKQTEKALEYTQKTLQLAIKANLPDLIQKSYENLSEIYEIKEEYQKALQAKKMSVSYKDSLFNQEKIWKTITLQDKFEDDKFKIKIDLLKLKNDRQKLTFYLMVILIVGIVLVSVIIFYYFKTKQKLSNAYQNQTQLLEESNNEAEAINKKLEHSQQRLKQNVKILQLTHQRLEELSSFQKAIWNNLEMIIFTIDKAGIITSINPTALKKLGYEEHEIIGKPSASLFLDDKQIKTTQYGQNNVEDEWDYITKKGETFKVNAKITPLKNDKNEVLGHIIVAQDASHLKKYQNILVEKQKELFFIQSIGKVGMWKIDFSKQKVDWDTEMFELFGLNNQTKSPTIDEFLNKFIHPDFLQKVIETIEETKNKGLIELQIKCFDAFQKEINLFVRTKSLYTESQKWVGVQGIAMPLFN
jgi:PAS domain S-box-containing protein